MTHLTLVNASDEQRRMIFEHHVRYAHDATFRCMYDDDHNGYVACKTSHGSKIEWQYHPRRGECDHDHVSYLRCVVSDVGYEVRDFTDAQRDELLRVSREAHRAFWDGASLEPKSTAHADDYELSPTEVFIGRYGGVAIIVTFIIALTAVVISEALKR